MAYVNEKNYAKLAEAIADDLITNKIPLNESISKLAAEMQLNQEQIKRLCETTNNTAFNKLFQKKADSDDRIVEFDVADSKKVLGGIVKAAAYTEVPVSVDAYELRELDDEMHWARNPEPAIESTQQKVAFELRPEAQASEIKDRQTLMKVRDHLRHQKMAADMEYSDKLAELRNRFRLIYDVLPFEEFEKQAVARFGTDAVAPLSDLRSLMHKPPVEYNIGLLAKTAGFVNDNTAEMQTLACLIANNNDRAILTKGLSKLEKMT